VNPGKDHHGDEHEKGVENVEEHLVGDEVAVVALGVFDKTEDGTDEDEDAGDVQYVQLPLPGDEFAEAGRSGSLAHACVEDEGRDDEAAKEEKLHDETTNDDLFTGVN